MKTLPSHEEMKEVLELTTTSSISEYWLHRKFKITLAQAARLFGELQGLGFINHQGDILIEQYTQEVI